MGISDSGWITSELFMDFMKHFAVHARCSPDNKTLLIFDGHNTHTKCLAVIDFVISKGIYLLSLPPHVTNKFQPLNCSFLKPLKAYFNNACQRWMRNHPGRCIKTEHLGELLKEAYLKAATLENAGSGFRNSKIVPFNPPVIPDHSRKPAEVFSEDVSAMIGDEVFNAIENNEDYSTFSSIIPIPQISVTPKNTSGEKSEIISSPEYRVRLVEAEGSSKGKHKSNTPKLKLKLSSKT